MPPGCWMLMTPFWGLVITLVVFRMKRVLLNCPGKYHATYQFARAGREGALRPKVWLREGEPAPQRGKQWVSAFLFLGT